MATIVVILDRYRRPVAEINTFDLDKVSLSVHQRPMLMDELIRPDLFHSWVLTYEQPMLESPEQVRARDGLNAHRLHAIREELDWLFARRNSLECATLSHVRWVRAQALDAIRAILAPGWVPRDATNGHRPTDQL